MLHPIGGGGGRSAMFHRHLMGRNKILNLLKLREI